MGKSLWGTLDELVSEIKFPKDILEEQAEYLKSTFDGLVKCRILDRTMSVREQLVYESMEIDYDFAFSFNIYSDYVKKYEYEICALTYGIKMYPLAISFGTGIADEVCEEFSMYDEDTIIVADEEQLLKVLQKILSSREVHQVLKGLVSMAKKERESKDMPF